MRPSAALLTTTLSAALLLSGCATLERTATEAQQAISDGLQRLEWCTAAFRLGQAVEDRDIEAGRDAAQDLQDSAPDELQDDLDVVIEAIEAAEAGDLSRVEGEEVRAAGEEIRAEAERQCDPTTRPD